MIFDKNSRNSSQQPNQFSLLGSTKGSRNSQSRGANCITRPSVHPPKSAPQARRTNVRETHRKPFADFPKVSSCTSLCTFAAREKTNFPRHRKEQLLFIHSASVGAVACHASCHLTLMHEQSWRAESVFGHKMDPNYTKKSSYGWPSLWFPSCALGKIALFGSNVIEST